MKPWNRKLPDGLSLVVRMTASVLILGAILWVAMACAWEWHRAKRKTSVWDNYPGLRDQQEELRRNLGLD